MTNRLQQAILICLGLSVHIMWAQSSWPNYPNNTSISVSSAGNVGIGTANPQGTLEVSNSATPASLQLTGGNCGTGGFTCLEMSLSATSSGYASLQGIKASGTAWGNLVLNPYGGNVGIGTANPLASLSVIGNITQYSSYATSSATPVGGSLYLGDYNYYNAGYYNSAPGLSAIYDQAWGVAAALGFYTYTGISNSRTERMRILSNGNVGIGTTSPQHLLHVAGTIGAEEVIVSSTGADYVFDPGYRLAPLAEVAGYINEYHHLPDIPSASNMQQKGASVGEMQGKLLAKIEELTLHMIQAEERSNQLEQENRELRKQIQEIKEVMAQ